MNPRVSQVKPDDNHFLILTFTNGEVRRFDMNPFLERGVFRELKDKSYFKAARVQFGTVQWPHEQDVCPDTLYEDSTPVAINASGA